MTKKTISGPSGPTSFLLENLNPEQRTAVAHRGGPLLIVAGAGTGKTTVITRRLAYLVEQKLARPDEILALTFTEKASEEMEARVDQLLPLGNYDLWISTFHSFCQRILEQHGIDIGLPNNFKLLDTVQQWILIYRNFDRFNLDYYRPLGNPNRLIDSLTDHFSKCKDETIKPEDYLNYAEQLKLGQDNPDLIKSSERRAATEIQRVEEIADAYHTYQKLLLDKANLDFGDLINYTLELFQRRPNILKYYQNKFKFILVDEFQDTNFAQYQLIKLLGAASNIVVVGDDDQSIYKFRGASVSNILKFKEEFSGVKEITLVQNYRSRQNILDLAYNFIQANNPDRLEPKLHIDKRLNSNAGDEGTIQVLEGKDLSEELDLVVKKVIELKLRHKDSSWNDFAILIRANAAASEIISRLDVAGITYTVMANRGLYRKRLIHDLISYCKLLTSHFDSATLYRLFNFSQFSLEPDEVAAISDFSHKKGQTLYETLLAIRTVPSLSEESIKKAGLLLSLMKKHAEAARTQTAVELFVAIVDDLGLPQLLEPDTLENAESREYLEQFYKKIEDFEQQNDDKTLKNFLQILELEMQAGSDGPIKFDPELGPESLKLLTVHSAKGLEFDFVFVVNLVDQRFPTRAHRDAIEIPESLIKDILPGGDFHLQEERRLFYVALTRAKTHLYLSWARDYGGAKAKKPSIFLVETKLVPSEKIAKATGKVVFTRPTRALKQSKKIVFHSLPTTFSFSELAAFETCPLEYKFRYYLHLPMPGAPALSFGKTIHKVLQQFAIVYNSYKQAQLQHLFGTEQNSSNTASEIAATLPDFKLMQQFYDQSWIDDWYHSKKEQSDYRKLGQKILKIVHEDFKQKRPNIKYIEQKFSLPLDKYQFTGKIDRIDEIGNVNGNAAANGAVLIDYKTSASSKNKIKTAIDQLEVYQWAAQDYLHETVKELQYWHLSDNQRIIKEPVGSEAIAQMKQIGLEMIEDIRHTIQYDLFTERHAKAKNHTCQMADYLIT